MHDLNTLWNNPNINLEDVLGRSTFEMGSTNATWCNMEELIQDANLPTFSENSFDFIKIESLLESKGYKE